MRTIVFFHTDNVYARGGEKYIYELASRLAKNNTVTIYLQRVSESWKNAYIEKGVNVEKIWTPGMAYWFFLPFTILINLYNLRNLRKMNAIIFATNFPLNFLAVLLTKKSIVHCFEPLPIFYDKLRIESLPLLSQLIVKIAGWLYRPLDRYAIANAAVVTTLNESVNSHIHDSFYKKANAFIPNGIDTDFFVSKRKRLKRKQFVIGHSTDYTVFKGTALLIETVPKLIRAIPNATICISESIHDSSVKTTYLNLAKKLGIEKYITFVGRLPEHKLVEFYQGLDVFCYLGSPYSPGGSTASLSVLEAQSCGIPVLRTRGTEEEIIHGKTGFYIADYTPEGVSKKIYEFYRLSTNQQSKMSANAIYYMKNNFSWDVSLKALEQVINYL